MLGSALFTTVTSSSSMNTAMQTTPRVHHLLSCSIVELSRRIVGSTPVRAPDPVVVVDRDRVVDPSLLGRLPHAVDLVLEGELRRVDSDHDQPVGPVGLRPARTY